MSASPATPGKSSSALFPHKSVEKKQWLRAQSAKILARNLLLRDQARDQLENDRIEKFHLFSDRRENYLQRWKEKLKHSPFATDLLAENERIAEEALARKREEDAKMRSVVMRREKAKNDIILTALSEFSDLEALRQEKRAILEEEQRIMALLALEKTNQHTKSDRIVADRALKQRQEAKNSSRRQKYKDDLSRVLAEEHIALRAKHGLEPIDALLTSSSSMNSFLR